MTTYYIVGGFLSLIAVLDYFTKDKGMRNLLLIYSFLLLFSLAGLRYGLSDYGTYVVFFKVTPSLDKLITSGFSNSDVTLSVEKGYLLLNSIIKYFFDDAVGVLLVVAFLAVGINLYCYRKMSPYPFLTVLLYFAHSYLHKDMIQIRSGLASALVLLSIIYVYRQQAVRSLSIILIATQIHVGAIVALVGFAFAKINCSKRVLYLLLGLSMVLVPLDLANRLFSFIEGFRMNYIVDKVFTYLHSDVHNYKIDLFNPTTIKQIIISFAGIKYRDAIASKLPYFNAILSFYIVSTIWLLVFNDFAIFAMRCATFLSVGEVVIIPSFLLLLKGELKFIGYYLVVLFAGVVLYLNTLKDDFSIYKNLLW